MVQRQTRVNWQRYIVLDNVVMTAYDTKVTTIDLASSTPVQVHKATTQTDADGTRTALLMFKQGTTATAVLPNGTQQNLTTLHVRATEYTVGANVAAAMPGLLPGNIAYTYAAELSIDEAIALGAEKVNFSKPVPLYVDNFLGIPVGEVVPTGVYDRKGGVWNGTNNGRVIKILSITNGVANIDIDGSGNAANATALAGLGIDLEEQKQLAAEYPAGKTLWRTPMSHFSAIDSNYFAATNLFPPNRPNPGDPQPDPDNECREGSIIKVQSQVLGKEQSLAGVPFQLHYQTDRTKGYTKAYSVTLNLTDATLPFLLKRVEVTMDVAGQRIERTFSAQANLKATLTWDGKDAYGRDIQGTQLALIRVTYVYPATYLDAPNLNPAWGIPGTTVFNGITVSLREGSSSQVLSAKLGTFRVKEVGLGGWTPGVHHTYDPVGRILHMGTGQRRSAQKIAGIVKTVANDSSSGVSGPFSLTFDQTGNYYFSTRNKIQKVDTSGAITTYAGCGTSGPATGDGGPAINAQLDTVSIAVDSKNKLYFVEKSNRTIRYVDTNGVINTLGVTPTWNPGGRIYADHIAIDAQDNIYAVDFFGSNVFKIDPTRKAYVIAGGRQGYSGDGGPAIGAGLGAIRGIAVSPKGVVYIVDQGRSIIRKVALNGTITTVAGRAVNGGGITGHSGDGGSAVGAEIHVDFLAVGQDGSLYLSSPNNKTIRRVDPHGIITTIAGIPGQQDSANVVDGIATRHKLGSPAGIAVAPDGRIYFADDLTRRIRKLIPNEMPGFSNTDIGIPSEDGELLYQFSAEGRHLRTINTRTKATVYSFVYDAEGRLSKITDGDGNMTSIQHDTNGKPVSITGPYGLQTTLATNTDGYLSQVTNAANETHQFTYTNGLLTKHTDPRNNSRDYVFNSSGLLQQFTNEANDTTQLTRTELTNGHKVTFTTPENRSSSYQILRGDNGSQSRDTIAPTGLKSTMNYSSDGGTCSSDPSGSTTTTTQSNDPRFGLLSPVASASTSVMPSGLTSSQSETRSVTLQNQNDPLSLQSQTDTSTFNGKTTTTAYDATTRTYTTTSAAGRVSTRKVDAQGRPLEWETPGAPKQMYTYDARGKLLTYSVTDGNTTRSMSRSYNANGWLQSLTDPLNRSLFMSYDAVGRLTAITLPDTQKLLFGHDKNGNLTSVTPPGKPAHTFVYDTRNNMASYTAPQVGSTPTIVSYSYDKDSRIKQMSRADGGIVIYTRDSAGRVTSTSTPEGTYATTYDSATGQISQRTAPGGSIISYSYNGQLHTQTSWSGPTSGSVSQTHNSDFLRATQSVNGGNTVSFQYDQDLLLTQAGALGIARNATTGLVSSMTLGQMITSISYDSFKIPQQVTTSHNGSTLFTESFVRDALFRITRKTEVIQGTTNTYDYTYDQRDRLKTVTKNGSLIATYSYDANGNRTQVVSGSTTISGSYDAQDRLTSYGNATYTYTRDGELRTKTTGNQTTTYTYGAMGQLRKVVLPSGSAIDYIIDAKHRRVGKKVNGVLTKVWLYKDQLNIVAELDAAGHVVSRFVYGTKEHVPAYMVKAGKTYRIVSDYLGSVRLVVDASTGAVVQKMDYDAWGNITQDTNPGFQPFGFAGGHYDKDTRLTRFGARDYDPQVGRWTAKDPSLFNGGMNVYSYAHNDPVFFVDIDGKEPVLTVSAVFVVKVAALFITALFLTQIASKADGCAKKSDKPPESRECVNRISPNLPPPDAWPSIPTKFGNTEPFWPGMPRTTTTCYYVCYDGTKGHITSMDPKGKCHRFMSKYELLTLSKRPLF